MVLIVELDESKTSWLIIRRVDWQTDLDRVIAKMFGFRSLPLGFLRISRIASGGDLH